MSSPTPAIQKLQKRLAKDPTSLVFSQLAEEYRKEGMLQEALQTCRDGLKRHPNYWTARVTLARVLQQLGQLEESRKELEQVVKAVPDHLIANRLLGDMYLAANWAEEALKRYRLIQMLAPGDSEMNAIVNRLEQTIVSQMPAPEPSSYDEPQVPAAATTPEKGEVSEPGAPASDVPESANGHDKDAEQSYLNESVAELLSNTDSEDETGQDRPLPPVGATTDYVLPSASDVIQSDPEITEIARILLQPEDQQDELAASSSSFSEEDPDENALMQQFEAAEDLAFMTTDQTQPIDEDEVETEDVEELTSQTLAELYVQQGLVDKAVKVYQKLLMHEPGNRQIQERLRQLLGLNEDDFTPPHPFPPTLHPQPFGMEAPQIQAHSSFEGSEGEQRRKKIATLQNWLAVIRKDRS